MVTAEITKLIKASKFFSVSSRITIMEKKLPAIKSKGTNAIRKYTAVETSASISAVNKRNAEPLKMIADMLFHV